MAAQIVQQVADSVKQVVGSAVGGVKAEKPITLYSHPGGPNPWKINIILNELNLPYETKIMDFANLKGANHDSEFEKNVNINGRVPAIEDPNTGITLWESGAIIDYLLETYDPGHLLSYSSGPEKWNQRAWRDFQMSGQGPYYGQRAWFTFYHPEKNLTSCLDRYGNEIRRVISVINAHLKTTGKPYLVGDKATYADLMFVPWHWLIVDPPAIMGENFRQEFQEKYPVAWAWHERLSARPAVEKAHKDRQEAMKAGH